MRMTPLPVVDGFYADEARPWSSQDVCNWLPTQAEQSGTRTPSKLATPPGLRPFAEFGEGVVRGLHECNGKLFAVVGTTLYQISNTGVAIPLGTIPGVSRVQMEHNQITSGNQLLVANGSAGYVYNTVTGTFQKITDEGYPGAIDVAFIDGYLIQIEPARRFAFNSDLADALAYNTLDRFTSEVDPDPLVGLVANNNELILFSTNSAEFFENTGSAQQPFRSKRITMDRGCAGTHTIAKLDNTVFWLGSDGKFYTLSGSYSPQRVSTRPIEQAIRGLNWSQAFAFIWEDSGHSVVYWTFPDGRTWGYDTSTQKWHRRASYGLNRWRANCTAFWNRKWIAGDFQRGRLWVIDWDYQMEGDQEIERELTTGVTHDSQTRVVMPRLEVVMQVGQEGTVAVDFPEQPAGPSITGTPPSGVVGEDYSGFAPTVTEGGAPIVSVVIVSGSLAPGMSFDGSSISIDAPLKNGIYPITWKVTDANGLSALHTANVVIECSGLEVGTEITATYTLGGHYTSASIFPLSNGNLGFVSGANGITVGNSYTKGELDSSLSLVSSANVTWTGFSIGDARLWPRGMNENGIGISADGNSGYCKMFGSGGELGWFLPTDTASANWWYNEDGWYPEYGGLVWFGDSGGGDGYWYLGVRRTNPYSRHLLKFPLVGGSPTSSVALISSAGSSTEPYFWMTRSRDGFIHLIWQDGTYQKFDEDLMQVEARASGFTTTNLRGFGVDMDVIALIYSGPSAGAQFRNINTGELIQSISSASMNGDESTRVIFTDDSCYIQCRLWVGRIEYTPPVCEITP